MGLEYNRLPPVEDIKGNQGRDINKQPGEDIKGNQGRDINKQSKCQSTTVARCVLSVNKVMGQMSISMEHR